MNDKILHMIATASILFIAYRVKLGFKNAIILALVAGIAKEIYDFHGHGTPDIADMQANMYGMGAGIALIAMKKVGLI